MSTKPPIPLSQLPTKPGCYLYKDIAGDIIYIGKAKNLRKRVSQYFQKDHDDIKTQQLVEHIRAMDFIVTKNEIEALLLESNLIKQHKPKYNIDLKYGVRYAWIVLTDEKFPRLLTARNKNIPGEYFGPFVNGYGRKLLVDILRKRFFIRTCRILPKKPCLRYHIGICKAPCAQKQDEKDYMEHVEKVRQYLKGNNEQLIVELEQEMKEHSDKLHFELAKQRKEQIDALSFLSNKILIENQRLGEEDVIHYRIYTDMKDYIKKAQFMVFSYQQGVLRGKEDFTVAYEEDVLDNFLKRFYEVTPIPPSLIIPHELSDESIEDYLQTLSQHSLKIIVPQRGLKKELLDMVWKNLESKSSEAELLSQEIMQTLELPHPIRTIECFDISHLSGTNTVAAMVHFKDGKPLKSQYRKFKIQTVDGVDDFRAMYEVVYRRYKRLKESVNSGTGKFPDLIIIDGGEIQVEFAQKAMRELGLTDIPMVGLAKKFEELYFPQKKNPVRYDKRSKMMKTFIQARDEAHRFGLTYHRLLRSKAAKK